MSTSYKSDISYKKVIFDANKISKNFLIRKNTQLGEIIKRIRSIDNNAFLPSLFVYLKIFFIAYLVTMALMNLLVFFTMNMLKFWNFLTIQCKLNFK